MTNEFTERRSEPRTIRDRFYSVEFSAGAMEFVYQFKIWDISLKGMCVVVREDSKLLKHLKVGDKLNMKYYTTDSSKSPENLKTEIRHITKDDKGRFRGHYLVGLSISENENSDL